MGDKGSRRLGRRAFLEISGRATLGLLAAGLRPARAEAPAATVKLMLAGDVMLGRGVDQVMAHPGAPELREAHLKSARDYVALAERVNGPIPRPVAPDYVWGDALGAMADAAPDLRIVNLETSVTRSDDWQPKAVNYRMHPANVDCLVAAGLDACVLANNHAMDFGRAGLLETLETLERAKLRAVGAGRNAAEAAAPAVFELPGGQRLLLCAVGSLSSGIPRGWAAGPAAPGVHLLEATTPGRIAASLERVRRPGDRVVVSVHWGGNWGYRIPEARRALAHRLIDEAGVDVVHGHSSHHPLGIEIYRDRPILYGCGDLLNDYEGIGGREEYRRELALLYFVTLDVATGRLRRLEMTPLRIARFRLSRASEADAAWLAARLDRESAPRGARVELAAPDRLALAWR